MYGPLTSAYITKLQGINFLNLSKDSSSYSYILIFFFKLFDCI